MCTKRPEKVSTQQPEIVSTKRLVYEMTCTHKYNNHCRTYYVHEYDYENLTHSESN